MKDNNTIATVIELHGFDLFVIDDFLQSSLTEGWEYYRLVKDTIPTSQAEEMLFKLCHLQRFLCKIREHFITNR